MYSIAERVIRVLQDLQLCGVFESVYVQLNKGLVACILRCAFRSRIGKTGSSSLAEARMIVDRRASRISRILASQDCPHAKHDHAEWSKGRGWSKPELR